MDTITIQVQRDQTSFIKTLLEQLKGVENVSVEKEETIGYTTKGEPLTASILNETVQNRLEGIKNGSRKTFTHEEVVKRVLKR